MSFFVGYLRYLDTESSPKQTMMRSERVCLTSYFSLKGYAVYMLGYLKLYESMH